jgi:hypothetical protein
VAVLEHSAEHYGLLVAYYRRRDEIGYVQPRRTRLERGMAHRCTSIMKVEHHRLHCAEQWADSPYKEAVLKRDQFSRSGSDSGPDSGVPRAD